MNLVNSHLVFFQDHCYRQVGEILYSNKFLGVLFITGWSNKASFFQTTFLVDNKKVFGTHLMQDMVKDALRSFVSPPVLSPK